MTDLFKVRYRSLLLFVGVALLILSVGLSLIQRYVSSIISLLSGLALLTYLRSEGCREHA
ncbi:MAG: hypothetical protein B7O98_07600 [Zestosphaera tikiterensis]|uniref:Uncharacterized protein n=1 Tax=Zestosphaera tikiterensis TaxID=1973259 RepID=A0A2R7Y556_9CREN|nr:MAG: hypothetical protein B7O98_07600 [Zestosphaera tikiterensis]